MLSQFSSLALNYQHNVVEPARAAAEQACYELSAKLRAFLSTQSLDDDVFSGVFAALRSIETGGLNAHLTIEDGGWQELSAHNTSSEISAAEHVAIRACRRYERALRRLSALRAEGGAS